MNKRRIMVVDDSLSTLQALTTFLQEDGYEVAAVDKGAKAESLFRKDRDFDVVLADLKMPGMDGLEMYRRLKNLDPNLLLIIMTAHGTIESSVEAMKEGVYDYLVKPLNMDELLLVLSKAIRERRREAELNALRSEVSHRYGFDNIVGKSQPMREVFDMVRSVAPTEATVLITGETGTGKELLTKAIHYNSNRKEAPFICINCAALSESLLESELFGYVKGAFTGADADRAGRLQAAHRGTLFLDEVGHMSLALQAKLLRFLQERTFEPVGSFAPRTVDVRVIAATNRNLDEEVKGQCFLPDLYYRLQVIQITAPPLRERMEDIPLLVDHFLQEAAMEHGRPKAGVGKQALQAMMSYAWPGNVRELSNTISRLVILGINGSIGLEDLPLPIRQAYQPAENGPPCCIREIPPQGISLREVEREVIGKTLGMFKGNRSLTAKALGISRKSLYERILRYKLD